MKLSTIVFVITFLCNRVRSETEQSCDSLVYCQGKLLETVQVAKIFEDAKNFVDMTQVNPPRQTLSNFENFMKKTNNSPNRYQVKLFVKRNFLSEGDVEAWVPRDFKSNPAFLSDINDKAVRNFAATLVNIWPKLAKKATPQVNLNPDRFSLIAVPNGFIVPGGRFKEMYYWDSYWIIKGLLLCEMYDTVRGMLDNFMFLVRKYGFIPNATRVYYLNRSQPPLLSLMIGLYIDATKDIEWLKRNIETIEKETKWWLDKKTITAVKDGVTHTLARFSCNSGTPRPESFFQDVKTCAVYKDSATKERCYQNIKSGAESGWDFSSRWMFDTEGGINANLTYIQTNYIAPVDLNSFLCRGFKEISRFHDLLDNVEKSAEWKQKFLSWKESVKAIFYDEKDGIWYDYDITSSKPRKYFYISNFTPLWSECYDESLKEEYGRKAANYFTNQGLNQFPGGIPASFTPTEEQWDWPNVWPPLQEVVALGFMKTRNAEAQKIAQTSAKQWIDAVILGYGTSRYLYEKYDCTYPGLYGRGGEYQVQVGFGWTNGVALSLIKEFYTNSVTNITTKK